MKPISLKIKGLNSFVEEQNIDFIRLTEKGLFGIFGPTGSGKTTILDGITLALYGEVSRKSSNYINTNCDKANIHFEFQISGAENKIYAIDREFRRDKKSNNPISGKCKITDITNGENEVLADKVKDVTNVCKEILGLSLEDFTRTVVLPQGKFSEFLKLEGKNRREMLERLFNLQQYGDNLSIKLSKEMSKNRRANDVLLGEMKGYENVNSTTLNEKKEELNLINTTLEKVKNEYKFIESKFNEYKEIWNLQLELGEYLKKEEELNKEKDEVNALKERRILGESINKVYPYILSYEKSKEDLRLLREKEEEISRVVNTLKDKKAKVEIEYLELKKTKEEFLPKLQEEKLKTEDALTQVNLLKEMKLEIKKLSDYKDSLENDMKIKEKEYNELNILLEELSKKIASNDKLMDEIVLSSEIKEKVHKGILLSEKKDEFSLQQRSLNNKLVILKDELLKEEDKIKIQSNFLEDKKIEIAMLEEELKNIDNNCPGSQKDVYTLQNRCNDNKEKWANYRKHNDEILKNKELIVSYNTILKDYKSKESNYSLQLDKLRKELKEYERLTLAKVLREELKENDICPVCGSKDHNLDIVHDYIDLKVNDEDINNLEKEVTDLRSEIIKLEIKINNCNEIISANKEYITALGKDFLENNVEELEKALEKLIMDIENYNNNKKVIEEKLSKSKEELYKLENIMAASNTKINENNKQINLLVEEEKVVNDKLKNIESEIIILSKEINVIDFIEKNKELIVLEEKRNNLVSKNKDLRITEESYIAKRDKNLNVVNTLKERIIKGESIIEEKLNNALEKENYIKDKVGDIVDLEGHLATLINKISQIEDSYNKIENEKELLNKEYTSNNELFISILSRVKELSEREVEEKNRINLMILEDDLKSIEYIKENYINKEKLGQIKEKIENHNSEALKVKGAIESLNKKINNKEITEEQWEDIQKDIKNIDEAFNKVKEDKIKKEEEVSLLEAKIKELDKLIKEKDRLDHRLALLNDLDKLFKGKKFVEFVAINRLKYISREASRRLREITNGNYALEVDDNGKFIIRDYKNGGVERDASTLSGGETFLASLSLSLALSSEIQLKGTAPLELFFLDEGFGTLDDNLLEVVMSSLERIHNDKLKIGLITHVESIKNRVPVKLLLTSAEAGKGSSCKIELS